VNGCFDVLHAGHVDFLERAKTYGNYMIVAVNDDRSVRELKGSGRPVFPLAQRMALLEALRCVDDVVEFGTEEELEGLIAEFKPDFLVKNKTDYPDESVVTGADVVREFGGQVVFIWQPPFKRTSDIIRSLKGKRRGKVKSRRLDPEVVLGLVKLFEKYGETGEAVHISDLPKKAAREIWRLEYWGFIEAAVNAETGKRVRGYYLPTWHGAKFIQGKVSAPASMTFGDGNIVSKSKAQVTVWSLLGFRYHPPIDVWMNRPESEPNDDIIDAEFEEVEEDDGEES